MDTMRWYSISAVDPATDWGIHLLTKDHMSIVSHTESRSGQALRWISHHTMGLEGHRMRAASAKVVREAFVGAEITESSIR